MLLLSLVVVGTFCASAHGNREPEMEHLRICRELNNKSLSDNVAIMESTECQWFLNITGLNTSSSGNWVDLGNDTNITGLGDDKLQTDTVLPWRITFNNVQYFITGIYFPILAILGLIGNAIILSVLRKNVLKSTSNIYLIGIAISDLVFVTFYFPFTFTVYRTIQSNLIYQSFRAFHFSYGFPVVSTFHTATVWIIIAFTVERFLAVTLPLKAQKYCTKTRAKFTVIGVFVFSVAFNFIRFFRYYPAKKIDPNTNQTFFTLGITNIGFMDEVTAWVFWSYLMVAEVVPFITLISLNSAIVLKLWQARLKRLKMTAENGPNEKSRETQITRILIAIVVAFLLCNSVAAAASWWAAVSGVRAGYSTQGPGVFYMLAFSHVFYITNPMTNCILYAACSSDMRNGIKSQLCIGRQTRDASKSTASTNSKTGQLENGQV